MTDENLPPDSKLTKTKERWAREGRFLTGRIARPEEQRLPPGQHLTRDWPVLDLGVTPNISQDRWRLDVYGALSDRIGRKPLLIFFGVAGTLSTIPILTALQSTKSPFTAFLLICAAWVFVAGYTSINAVVKAELFPTNIRALGVGLPYALTVSIFGGTAPMIALYFKSLGHEQWFYYYLSGMIFLSLIIYATMRDTKHNSAMHRHE